LKPLLLLSQLGRVLLLGASLRDALLLLELRRLLLCDANLLVEALFVCLGAALLLLRALLLLLCRNLPVEMFVFVIVFPFSFFLLFLPASLCVGHRTSTNDQEQDRRAEHSCAFHSSSPYWSMTANSSTSLSELTLLATIAPSAIVQRPLLC
jgi:hypothetical protein